MIRGKYLLSGEDAAAVMDVRHRVFVEEQGFSPHIEVDEYDQMAVYALATDESGAGIAAGRLILKDDHFTIGRICVLKEHRGQGFGDFIVRMLLHRALSLGVPAIYLSSQMQTVDFYLKYGFQPIGEVYLEAGVAHQAMRALREDIRLEGKCASCAKKDACDHFIPEGEG